MTFARQLLSTLAFAALLSGCARGSHDLFGEAAPGRRLHFVCSGSGSPTVLFEGGFAANAQAWYKVRPLLSPGIRACAYDRAGAGRSDPGPLPRDGAAIAADLDAALRSARISGPFVLVGHSAGALYARLLFERRPADVVGMVFVDPSVEFQDQAFGALSPGAGSVNPLRAKVEHCLVLAQGWGGVADPKDDKRCLDDKGKLMPASVWTTQMSELDTLWRQTSVEVARARRPYGAMPIIVLTASDTYPGDDDLTKQFSARWRVLHKALAGLSSRGEERLVQKSSHLMPLDQPQAIVDAITDVIARAGSPGAPTPRQPAKA
jgi:pimeloyl-ACP methyl ester carboxylesterase